MKKVCFIWSLLLCLLLKAYPQQRNFFYDFEALGSVISSENIPFWLRSNQYGSIPLDNISLSLIGSVHKDYDRTKTRLIDWGASVESRLNIGQKSNLKLIEAYGKFRISIFEIKAGRAKEMIGLCDTSLSSGSFSLSGNALGIPQVQIAIPEFYSLPIFGKLFAFKGNYVHGWLGETSVRFMDYSVVNLKTYFHQKSLYGRFGKPGWKWKLYGGFNHQVFWGSEEEYYGSNYTLSDIECYFYIITGKPYGTNVIPSSKIGNHLGSIDLGFEYNFQNVRLLAYHQFFYDIGALYYLANIRDGLNGLSLLNKQCSSEKRFQWKKILLEVLYTKNQAGEFWSPLTPSGDEDYYNSDQYIKGWSYKDIGLGTPLICTRTSIYEELPTNPGDYFVNNRVVAFLIGFEGSIQRWDFVLKTSYSLNYGTFGTSEVGHTLGKIRTLPRYGIFPETKQLSAYFEVNKELKRDLNFGIIGAFDAGHLYYNSSGLLLRLSKSF
ncbi:hypothetical protein ES705_39568 [subsurface metagenome]